MTLLLFILVLAVLIFVHELGHFIAAKRAGVRVDEFALGFPPRIFSWKRGETRYSLNLIPMGGYVKILGEDPWNEDTEINDLRRSLMHQTKWVQARVLAAGVFFNFLFAWLLISFSFVWGQPASVGEEKAYAVRDARITITNVLSSSPAEGAGLSAGDALLSLSSGGKTLVDNFSVANVQNFINESASPIQIAVLRGTERRTVTVSPQSGIVADRRAIGVAMDLIGTLKLPIHEALWRGLTTSVFLVGAVVKSFWDFFGGVFSGTGGFGEISGPVGIAGLIGASAHLGFSYFLSFVAVISINLAVLNLIPFPALDGGRLLFILIEAIKGSPISPKVARVLNTGGFAFLLLLMVLVTYHDIWKML